MSRRIICQRRISFLRNKLSARNKRSFFKAKPMEYKRYFVVCVSLKYFTRKELKYVELSGRGFKNYNIVKQLAVGSDCN